MKVSENNRYTVFYNWVTFGINGVLNVSHGYGNQNWLTQKCYNSVDFIDTVFCYILVR